MSNKFIPEAPASDFPTLVSLIKEIKKGGNGTGGPQLSMAEMAARDCPLPHPLFNGNGGSLAQHESVAKAGQVVPIESFWPKRRDGTNMPRNQVVIEDLVELINEHGGIVKSCASRRIGIFQ